MAIGSRPYDICWPRLLALLDDPVEEVRLAAIATMGTVARPSDLSQIETLAHSSDKRTAGAATQALESAKSRLAGRPTESD